MAWFAEPSVKFILLDANRVAPHRSHASDGTIGDAAHSASTSDHNPDTDGGVHACDVTHDPEGGYDAHAWALKVADRIKAGKEKRVKYIVTNDGKGADQIFNPSVSLTWRQNGAYKTEHRNHCHYSILYTDAAENDVTPFFVSDEHPEPPPAPPVEETEVSASFYYPVEQSGFLHRMYVATVADVGRKIDVGDLMHLYGPPTAQLPQGAIENMTKRYATGLGPQVAGSPEFAIRPNSLGSIIDGTTVDKGSGTIVTWTYVLAKGWKCVPYFAPPA